MKLFYLVHSIGIWKLVWGTCFCQHYSVERWQNFEVLALELGCKVGELPSSYLGLPLGALHKSMVVCGKDDISLKEGKLLSFKAHCLACLFTTCPYTVCQEWLD